jgi:hypothetical protein
MHDLAHQHGRIEARNQESVHEVPERDRNGQDDDHHGDQRAASLAGYAAERGLLADLAPERIVEATVPEKAHF